MVRERRDRNTNSRSEAVEGLNKEMVNMGKELERDGGKVEMPRSTLVYIKARVFRLASKIDG